MANDNKPATTTVTTTTNAKPADPEKGKAAAAADPLVGVENFGVVSAGGKEAHERLVASDPHAFKAIPGATGPEAVGSGQPVIAPAAAAMKARLDAGVIEPPKIGPVPNTDLYDTPGGYVITPAGVKPGGEPVAAPVIPARVEGTEQHETKVAGSGEKTAK